MTMKAFEPVARDLKRVRLLVARAAKSPAPAFEEMRREHFRRPGKMLRPGLFLLCVRSARTVRREDHAVAAALELIHLASLLHDDVLDEARTRRHAPSANARWGNRAALLFGDVLFSAAFRLVCDAGQPEACATLGRIITSLCEGECLQAALGRAPRTVTEPLALRVATGKTAVFFAEACRLGAHCAGCAPEAWAEYGERFGLAYQILDDVIDLCGSEAREGKTLHSDLLLGRPTLPLAFALRLVPKEMARLALPATPETAGAMAALMARCGAIDGALDRAREEIRAARAALERAGHGGLNGIGGCFEEILAGLEARIATLCDAGASAPGAER